MTVPTRHFSGLIGRVGIAAEEDVASFHRAIGFVAARHEAGWCAPDRDDVARRVAADAGTVEAGIGLRRNDRDRRAERIARGGPRRAAEAGDEDRKSTRLNSSH